MPCAVRSWITASGQKSCATRPGTGARLRIVNSEGDQVVDTWAFAADGSGEHLSMEHSRSAIYHLLFRPGDVLLMGRESAGLPADVRAGADARVQIPMADGTRSLNIAVAAGIAVAEALRQLRGAAG